MRGARALYKQLACNLAHDSVAVVVCSLSLISWSPHSASLHHMTDGSLLVDDELGARVFSAGNISQVPLRPGHACAECLQTLDLLYYFVGDASKAMELGNVQDCLLDHGVDVFADLARRDHIALLIANHPEFPSFLTGV